MLIFKSIKERFFHTELLNHPIFWAIMLYLGWIVISIVPSEMTVVSIKYFLVRFWFIGIFFYLSVVLFHKDQQNINRFLWAYIIGMVVVVLLTLVKHAGSGLLNQRAAHSACAPFFIDHTSYGAALAFTIPITIFFAIKSKQVLVRFISMGLSAFFVIALILSYSRAAWLSLVLAGGVWFLVYLRIRFRTIVATIFVVVAVFFTFQDDILWRLERNTTESSGDLMEHIHSIYNIQTDASNLERINRWNAALDMFQERPLFGWGPGTYQFLYAPFQRTYLKTIISTNFGTLGNAHSEYLGLMAETGTLAVIGYVLILFFALLRGFKLTRALNDDWLRGLVLACLIGLITYVIHGFLNNFLDSDKIAAPFWGFIAIIVAVDLYHRNEEIENRKQEVK
jgi:O-antigen ligase